MDLGAFLANCRSLSTEPERRLAVLAAIVDRLRGTSAGDIPLLAHRSEDIGLDDLPEGWARPELLVAACEATQPRAGRRAAGAFYTPPHVAAAIVREVLDRAGSPNTVCDPAAGAGAFLLAAGRLLIDRGVDARTVVEDCLFGADLDPIALLCADAALRLLAGGAAKQTNLLAGDALLGVDWAGIAPGGFDAVVGNPPFLNQLQNATVRTEHAALRARYGEIAAGYADTATIFLALALRLTRAGGAFGMILPESTMATRDAKPLRSVLSAEATLAWIWRSIDNVFDAGVQVCAPVFVRNPPGGSVEIHRAIGARVEPIATLVVSGTQIAARPTWSWLFADTRGIPLADLADTGTLGAWCTASADFRDQYYGLVPHVREADGPTPAPHERRLVTVGLIEPARLLWGVRRTRFAKVAYDRPVVDVATVLADPKLASWARARLVPKLLLSTQTRVLEVLADPDGTLLPSIPTISIVCAGQYRWHVGAALSSPVLTAWALTHFAGAALATDAIKLSAKQVLALPAPTPGTAWDRGADAYRAASHAASGKEWRDAFADLGRHTCAAYGVPPEQAAALVDWWTARLPAWTD